MAILSIQHLSKNYGNTKALSDISLEIPKGGIFGLLGPNGAGKTTLIRIINQIIEADSGTILFNNTRLGPNHIAKIGYLPEERGLYKKMKVGDQLRYFARLKGMSGTMAKERVNSWLKKLDILSWQDKRIDDLSKGMAQKVQFITTVLHEPELLILDEPFSGFDPVNAEIIRNEILELREKGTTLVISTHRMESVEQLCDQIAMIYRSEKILDGKLRDIKQSFRPHQFRVQLKTDHPDTLPYPVMGFEDGMADFNVSLETKTTNEVLTQLMAHGQVVGFREVLPSMEEIFIEQVKNTPMSKVWLVIQREYLARVQKKSFLVATLLTPLIFPAIMGLFLWVATSDTDSDSLRIIEVVDENNMFFLESSDQYAFSFSNIDLTEGKRMVIDGERFGFLYIPKIDLTQPTGITYFGEKNANMGLITMMESSLKRRIEEQRLFQSGISPDVINAYRTKVSIRSITLDESGDETITDATVNYAIGFLAGILIYVFIFLYGNQIMQGVIEEKSSRIIEILVSSLRPFQLMMGKIIGIGAVGLTQFLIWVVLIGTISSIVVGYFGMQMPQQQALEMANSDVGAMMAEQSSAKDILQVISGIDFVQLVATFTFYFLGGYLFYGAFFAAVGAAVDAPSEAQQFMFPVTIPLLIGYMGLFVFVLNDPNSQTSFWLSIIPFTSPIGMMGRISYGVPLWELLLSMGLLIGGFFASTWLAAKIYRIGILVHGTKVNYKTLWRWLKSSH